MPLLGALLVAASGCSVAAKPPKPNNAGLGLLVRDIILEQACEHLERSYVGLPSPTEKGAKGGTWLIERCAVTERGPRIRMELGGLAWEGQRRIHDAAVFTDPVALRLQGVVESDIATGYDPQSGNVGVWLHAGSRVQASAEPVGPPTASPDGIFPWLFDLVGMFQPEVANTIRTEGGAQLSGQLGRGVSVFFDPRGLQVDVATGIVAIPEPHPFVTPSWSVNERVYLGRDAVLVRGPFPASAHVRVIGVQLRGSATVSVVCADALGPLPRALQAEGTRGAVRVVQAAMMTGLETPLGANRPIQSMPCPWVLTVASQSHGALADVLVTREPS